MDAIGIAIGAAQARFGELHVQRLPALSCDELLFLGSPDVAVGG
jgi:hypothetical protein